MSSATERALPDAGTVTMFTTAWCGYCRRLKSQMDREGIGYTEVDIEAEPGSAEYVMSVNGGNRTVPTLCSPTAAPRPTPRSARSATASAESRASAQGHLGGVDRPAVPVLEDAARDGDAPDTRTLPSSTARRRSSRLNHRASSISSSCSRRSVPRARAVKPSISEVGNGHGWSPR